jgi:hypothetical protein
MARKAKRSRTSAASAIRSHQYDRQKGSRGHAHPFVNDVLGIAGALLRNTQEGGAERISSMAAAARNIAAELSDVPYARTYVATTADKVDMLADYVADNSLEQMIEDGTSLAKRYPVSTLAFAIAAGYGLTRLLASQNLGNHGRTGRRASKASAKSPRSRSAKSANGSDKSHASANAP